jgi:hypothetical protein
LAQLMRGFLDWRCASQWPEVLLCASRWMAACAGLSSRHHWRSAAIIQLPYEKDVPSASCSKQWYSSEGAWLQALLRCEEP